MALSDIPVLARNEEGIAKAISVLKQKYSERFETGTSFREQHSHTTTYLPSQLPDGVFFPTSSNEIIDVVNVCRTYNVPIIPFGVGSSLEGQVNAPQGGISIDLSRMNKIIQVNAEDLDVVVEPGVTREQLNEHLRDTGLFFPIDPGANATIGGMASTRASGTNAVRYGTMRDNVRAVSAVLASGEEITTAKRAKKTSAGYDLTALFVGSEGTLGILTSITLKLQGIPESIVAGVCSFSTVEEACNAVIMTIQMGIPVARIELLDELQMKASNAYSQLDYPESPTLFVEFHGSESSTQEQAETFNEIAAECNGGEFIFAKKAEKRNELWKARHNGYWAALALKPGAKGISTDVCVPISRLAECVVETQKDIADMGFIAPIVGHAGDGNFHVLVLLDPDNASDIERAESFIERLNNRALAMDGTCTGEHGIGQGKQRYLGQELGGSVNVMRQIKQTLDPLGIMNPGKVFPADAS